MSKWESVTIGSLLESGVILDQKDGNHGSNYPRVEEFGDKGVPFLTASSLATGDLDIINAPRLNEERANTLRYGFLKPGDVLLSHNATVGRVAVVPDFSGKMLIGTSLTYYRVNKEKLSPYYLAIFFEGEYFQNQLKAVMSQTTRNQVPITAQRQLKVILPPLKMQISIASMLGVLDNKIAINKRINELLENLSHALFQSWFVDFDPVKARLAAKRHGRDPERAAMAVISGKLSIPPGKPKPETLDNQLPSPDALDAAIAALDELSDEQRDSLAHTASLFPDDFEESELGLVPKDWGIVPLSSFIELIGGGTPKKSEQEYWGGNILWFSVKDAPSESDVFVTDTELKISKKGLEKSSARLVRPGTIIISARGTVGKLAVAANEMTFNQSCYGINPADGYTDYFIYFLIKRVVYWLQNHAHGGVFDTITRATFDTVKYAKIPEELAQEFQRNVQAYLEKIKSNNFENRLLAQIRDALLPKLFSGEIRIPEADQERVSA